MDNEPAQLVRAIPTLRIFDEKLARAFYLDYLGFRFDWEHRFDGGAPLYMQVSRDGVLLHLSEHYGDCSPGAAVRIETRDIRAFHAELAAKRHLYSRPGLERMPWGTEEAVAIDPFGNRLIFYADADEGADAGDEAGK